VLLAASGSPRATGCTSGKALSLRGCDFVKKENPGMRGNDPPARLIFLYDWY
jgi:hypothetical protein